jgi:hypothetical protein
MQSRRDSLLRDFDLLKEITKKTLDQISPINSYANITLNATYVPIIANSLREAKIKDINCLSKMYHILENIGSEKFDYKEALYKIANFCGGKEGISFNDGNDSATFSIRNRYGHRIRNKGKRENEVKHSRIDFENLFRIKTLIDGNVVLPDDTIINTALTTLKKKIERILYEELQEDNTIINLELYTVSQEPPGDEDDIEMASLLVAQEYPKLIFHKFKAEALHLRGFELNSKESIYVFARKCVILGELLHELSEITSNKDSNEHNSIFSLFYGFNNLRNGFIHFNFHLILLSLIQGEKSKEVQQYAETIVTNLIYLCSANNSLLETVINVEHLKKCKESVNNLYYLLQPNKKIKMRNKLLKKVFLANQLFEIFNSDVYKDLMEFLQQHKEDFSDEMQLVISSSEKDKNLSYLLSLEKHIGQTLNTDQFKILLGNFKYYIENNSKILDSESYKNLVGFLGKNIPKKHKEIKIIFANCIAENKPGYLIAIEKYIVEVHTEAMDEFKYLFTEFEEYYTEEANKLFATSNYMKLESLLYSCGLPQGQMRIKEVITKAKKANNVSCIFNLGQYATCFNPEQIKKVKAELTKFKKHYLDQVKEICNSDAYQNLKNFLENTQKAPGVEIKTKLDKSLKANDPGYLLLLRESVFKRTEFQKQCEVLFNDFKKHYSSIENMRNSQSYNELINFLIFNKNNLSELMTFIVDTSLQDNNPSQLLLLEKHIPKKDMQHKGNLQRLLKNLRLFLLRKEFENIKIRFFLFLEGYNTKLFLIDKLETPVSSLFDEINKIEFDNPESIRIIRSLYKPFLKSIGKASEVAKGFSKFFNELQQKLKVNKVSSPSLSSLENNFQVLIGKLLEPKPDEIVFNENDKEELINEFKYIENSPYISFENSQVIQELANQKLSIISSVDSSRNFTTMISKEMNYLLEIESTPNLPMKHCIIEHIVTLIGQYVRDVENKAIENQVFLNYTSLLAGRTAKAARSKGLAHEIFNFNEECFLGEVMKDIYTSIDDFSAISYIADANSSIRKLNTTSMLYSILAKNYARLSLFDNAIELLEKALIAYIKEIPPDEFNQNSVTGQAQLYAMGITQPNAVLIDFNEVIFGISSFELDCYANLLKLCIQTGNIEKNEYFFNLFLDKAQIIKIQEYQEKNIAGFSIDRHTLRAIHHSSPNYALYQPLITIFQNLNRPFVIGNVDEAFLLKTVSTIFLNAAKAQFLAGAYKGAHDLLTIAYGFIVMKIKEDGKEVNITNIETIDNELMMRCNVDLAACNLYMNNEDEVIAEFFANQALHGSNPMTRLLARNVLLRSNYRKGIRDDRELAGYEQDVNSCIHEIKKNHGDEYFYYLTCLHSLKLDNFIYKRDFESVKIYIDKLEKEIFSHYLYQPRRYLVNLYLSIYKSCLEHLDFNLSKKVSIININLAKKYFERIYSLSVKCSNIDKLADYLTCYIVNYAIYYFDNDEDRKIQHLKEALVIHNKYDTNSNAVLINISKGYYNISQELIEDNRFLLALHKCLKSLNYLSKIEVEKLTFQSCVEVNTLYLKCYKQLKFLCNKLQANIEAKNNVISVLDNRKQALEFNAKKYSGKVYTDGMFFTGSIYAKYKQPYGPYSDTLCTFGDPVTMKAVECSHMAKRVSKFLV